MDAKETFAGYEQTLPVLSRPPWSADSIPPPDPVAPPTLTSDLSVKPVPPPKPVSKPTERNASKVRKPRKTGNASGKSTLFWVNSDPQSASGGTKEETLKRIRSHVMSEHNRKKRLENKKQYKGKSWKHLAFQPSETIPGGVGPPGLPVTAENQASASTSTRTSNSHSHSTSARTSVSGSTQTTEDTYVKQALVPVSTTTDYYNTVPVESWDQNVYDEVVGYQTQPAPVWTYIGSGAHDPFNTGHTQLTDRMMRHLQNCESRPWLANTRSLLTFHSPVGSDTRSASVANTI